MPHAIPDLERHVQGLEANAPIHQGPAMLVNDQVFTHVTPEKVHDILEACRRSFGPTSMQKEGIAI